MKCEWFNPKEQTPAIYGLYLVIVPYKGILSRKYDFEVAFFDENDTWWGNKTAYINDEVLAWTELPKLPVWLGEDYGVELKGRKIY